MDKKAMLIKILDQLEPVRELAKGLKILVQEGNLWEKELDLLIEAVGWAVHFAKNEQAKQKLQKGMDVLQKIKDMEEKEEQEEIDLDLELF